jgi:predicted O-methyltransferase YrrM
MVRLWMKDVTLAAALGTAVLIAGLSAIAADAELVWLPAIAAASIGLALIVLETYRRLQIQVKEAAAESSESLKATFHQIEALLSVIHTIEPTFPLPATRTWSASPDILNQLCKLILTHRPDQIVEVGSGVSTLTMAYCLRRLGRGRIVSLESDPVFAGVTRQMLADHGLSSYAVVVDAPLTEITIGGEQWRWYDRDRIPSTAPIDLLFVDGPHGLTQPLARYPALPVFRTRLAPDAIVVLDDGARPDERVIADRWSQRFGFESEYLFMEKGAFLFRPSPSARPTRALSLAGFGGARLEDPASVPLQPSR